MSISINKPHVKQKFGGPFWVVWAIELWERFGYYGVQAVLALYFVKQLGYSESDSFYVFGSFSAFVFGFIWIGGWIGDKYLGAKRAIVLGAIILMLSYIGLALATRETIFYALAGIVVGNALFKANPSSLISKMYAKGDPALDGAMTLYYMGINLGAIFSMAITPIVAEKYGWSYAYGICALGLFLGLANFYVYRAVLRNLNTAVELKPLDYGRLIKVILGSIVSLVIIAQLLDHTLICDIIIYTVVAGAFVYFLWIAFSLQKTERMRMLVAFILIIQAVLFFVLYNQIPTSLTFFAVHNVDNHIGPWVIPAAEYQVLNSIVIVVMSPVLVWLYRLFPATHVSKFCIGMSLASIAFLLLAVPSFISTTGLASPWWLVASYYFQSVGELYISALGLAMVAELCPLDRSGFVMGVWFLTSMLAGPVGAWVGALTVPPASEHLSTLASMHLYGKVFLEIGAVTGLLAVIMWGMRPMLNRLLVSK